MQSHPLISSRLIALGLFRVLGAIAITALRAGLFPVALDAAAFFATCLFLRFHGGSSPRSGSCRSGGWLLSDELPLISAGTTGTTGSASIVAAGAWAASSGVAGLIGGDGGGGDASCCPSCGACGVLGGVVLDNLKS